MPCKLMIRSQTYCLDVHHRRYFGIIFFPGVTNIEQCGWRNATASAAPKLRHPGFNASFIPSTRAPRPPRRGLMQPILHFPLPGTNPRLPGEVLEVIYTQQQKRNRLEESSSTSTAVYDEQLKTWTFSATTSGAASVYHARALAQS